MNMHSALSPNSAQIKTEKTREYFGGGAESKK